MLENIAQQNAPCRIRYDGSLEDGPPNDHCFFDHNTGEWFENDDHLRGRINTRLHAEK